MDTMMMMMMMIEPTMMMFVVSISILSILLLLIFVVVSILVYIYYQRRRTYHQLKTAIPGLPVIYWIPPQFRCMKKNQSTKKYPSSSPVVPYNNNKDDDDNDDDTEDSCLLYHDLQSMVSSTNITNVLPRMLRLNQSSQSSSSSSEPKSGGSNHTNTNTNNTVYDMYGTVYGIHTPVIHMAHPIPIQSILSSNRSNNSNNSHMNSNTRKSPAYNHFHSFCGNGVFTTDNNYNNAVDDHDDTNHTSTTTNNNNSDWSRKRHAVLNALLMKPYRSPSSSMSSSSSLTLIATSQSPQAIQSQPPKSKSFLEQLEWECHVTALRLIQTLQQQQQQPISPTSDDGRPVTTPSPSTTTTTSSLSMNIVPLFQRATIGLMYRYITHDNDQTIFMTTNTTNELEQQHHERHGPPTVTTTAETTTTTNTNKQTTTTNNNDDDDDDDSNIHHTTTTSSITTTESFIQQYIQAITNIRLILMAKSRSLWYLLLPTQWYEYMAPPLHRMEHHPHCLPTIQQMAVLACQNAQCHSPLYTLLQNPMYATIVPPPPQSLPPEQRLFSKNIIDETITLLFAGQDTTAATLSWTMHLLTLYPHVQQQLYTEIAGYIMSTSVHCHDDDDDDNGNHSNLDDSIGTIRKNDVMKMTLLDAVIKESMRLYPVAPFIVRNIGGGSSSGGGGGGSGGGGNSTSNNSKKIVNTTTNDQHNEHDNNINTNDSSVFRRELPKNTMACIWIYSLHRHPTYWSKPNEFIPERWLVNTNKYSNDTNKETTAMGRNNYTTTPKDLGMSTVGAYIPYAMGARNCLGQPMANIILRILLCHLILQYEFIDERVADKMRQTKNTPSCDEPLPFEEITKLQKDMQAGFTILPLGGVELTIKQRPPRHTNTR